LWLRLVDEAGEDAVAEAARVGVTQAERDLAADGFDVEAERARAEAWLEERAERAAPRAPEEVSGPGLGARDRARERRSARGQRRGAVRESRDRVRTPRERPRETRGSAREGRGRERDDRSPVPFVP
jgi:hypothetical protein